MTLKATSCNGLIVLFQIILAFDGQDGTDYNFKTGPTCSGEARVQWKNNQKKIRLCFPFEKKNHLISLL